MYVYVYIYVYIYIYRHMKIYVCMYIYIGKTGVTAGRDKIEFRLFNSSSIFNITLREELFSLPKKNQTCYLVPVSWC